MVIWREVFPTSYRESAIGNTAYTLQPNVRTFLLAVAQVSIVILARLIFNFRRYFVLIKVNYNVFKVIVYLNLYFVGIVGLYLN